MPYGHLIDYCDVDGNVIYPTAEECKKGIPNAKGWWTPIENGGFFTGLYAYALIEQYSRVPDAKTAQEVQILMNGLFLLQDVAMVDGFIARGVADDGISHYPCSSDDQLSPWVLAMYAYYRSALCKDTKAVHDRLLRVLLAVKNFGWRIPTEFAGVYTNKLCEKSGWRDVTSLLFYAYLVWKLTGTEEAKREFLELANEKLEESGQSRIAILSEGFTHDLITKLGKIRPGSACAVI